MSSLTKEICRYCSKNISVGQIIIECDNCKSLAHEKYYEILGYEMKDDELLCDVCVKDHVQRYNGRAGISFRQLKKLSIITECMLLFQKVKKTHEQFSRLKRLNI